MKVNMLFLTPALMLMSSAMGVVGLVKREDCGIKGRACGFGAPGCCSPLNCNWDSHGMNGRCGDGPVKVTIMDAPVPAVKGNVVKARNMLPAMSNKCANFGQSCNDKVCCSKDIFDCVATDPIPNLQSSYPFYCVNRVSDGLTPEGQCAGAGDDCAKFPCCNGYTCTGVDLLGKKRRGQYCLEHPHPPMKLPKYNTMEAKALPAKRLRLPRFNINTVDAHGEQHRCGQEGDSCKTPNDCCKNSHCFPPNAPGIGNTKPYTCSSISVITAPEDVQPVAKRDPSNGEPVSTPRSPPRSNNMGTPVDPVWECKPEWHWCTMVYDCCKPMKCVRPLIGNPALNAKICMRV